MSYSNIVLPFIGAHALPLRLKRTLLIYSLMCFSLSILSIVVEPFLYLHRTWLTVTMNSRLSVNSRGFS